MTTQEQQDVLDFWFGPLDEHGLATAAYARRWFATDQVFDGVVCERFGLLHQRIVARECEHWQATPTGALAYVIVLDQFSRNMFRQQAQAFAYDEQALAAAQRAIAAQMDLALRGDQRSFLYLPFMHSEQLAMQDAGVEFYRHWAQQAGTALTARVQSSLLYAERHRDIIARFGRFPHRNVQLQRPSSAQELAFLQTPGSHF